MLERFEKYFPEAVCRNRGYVPMLIPVVLLWGGALVTLLLSTEQAQVAQEVVNFFTYAVIGIGVVSVCLRSWTEVSTIKLWIALGWSACGVVTYVLLATVLVGTGYWIAGLLSQRVGVRTMVGFGMGGAAALYGWYRLNWWLFRKIKDRFEEGWKKELREVD